MSEDHCECFHCNGPSRGCSWCSIEADVEALRELRVVDDARLGRVQAERDAAIARGKRLAEALRDERVTMRPFDDDYIDGLLDDARKAGWL